MHETAASVRQAAPFDLRTKKQDYNIKSAYNEKMFYFEMEGVKEMKG